MRNLVYFRKNLRLHDNTLVREALQSGTEVLFIYKLPKFSEISSPKSNFLWETLCDLRSSLKNKGHDLILFKEDSPDFICDLQDRFTFNKIFIDDIPAFYESQELKRIENKLSKKLVSAKVDRILNYEDLNFQIKDMPDGFTPFRKKIEKNIPFYGAMPECFENANPLIHDLSNTLWDLRPDYNKHSDTAFPFKGGETAAKKRIESYFFDSHRISTYKKTRNGMVGSEYSSKLSPWLANGSLSVRYVWEKVLDYEQQIEENDSTYWLKFELLWREYFRWLYEKYERRFFHLNGLYGHEYSYEQNEKKLDSWKNATTGNSFIDANMLELNSTGFMSNRGRQNVASYLIHHLNQDWRQGAMYFEEKLIDDDVYSNWGNWLYLSGVGTDPRSRVFNPDLQASRYDPNAEFQNLWLNQNK